jgi:hypothetical protein
MGPWIVITWAVAALAEGAPSVSAAVGEPIRRTAQRLTISKESGIQRKRVAMPLRMCGYLLAINAAVA